VARQKFPERDKVKVQGFELKLNTREGENRMVEFPVNPERRDPYPDFKFRVKWDGEYIPGISRVSGLWRTTEVIAHREGGDPSTDRKAPGRTDFEPITLERGLTQDLAFENWANKVWSINAAPGSEVSLDDFRKDIYIELYNEAGQLVMAWNVYRCWPSEYALPALDANTAAVAIEHIKLENEGWERDPSVVEPPEPTTNNP
jgi:phage tail-like protein